MAVRAVLCDLGGVVIRLDSDRIRHCWAARSRLPPSEVYAAYPDAVYEAFERDEVTEEQYLAHVRDRLQLRADDEEIADDFNQLYLGVDGDVLELLGRASHQGATILALTNTNRTHHRVWSERFAAELGVFDAIHCSHELRARKPEPAAFRRVLDAHGLEAWETAFIDDVPEYVHAARDLGLQGLIYTGPAELAVQLSRMGALDGGPDGLRVERDR